MKLAYWMYTGPAHIGTLQVASSFKNVHAVMHASFGDDYFNVMRSMLERGRDFTLQQQLVQRIATYWRVASKKRLLTVRTERMRNNARIQLSQHPRVLLAHCKKICKILYIVNQALIYSMSDVIPAEVNHYRVNELQAADRTSEQTVRHYPNSRGEGASLKDSKDLPRAWSNTVPHREAGPITAIFFIYEKRVWDALRIDHSRGTFRCSRFHWTNRRVYQRTGFRIKLKIKNEIIAINSRSRREERSIREVGFYDPHKEAKASETARCSPRRARVVDRRGQNSNGQHQQSGGRYREPRFHGIANVFVLSLFRIGILCLHSIFHPIENKCFQEWKGILSIDQILFFSRRMMSNLDRVEQQKIKERINAFKPKFAPLSFPAQLGSHPEKYCFVEMRIKLSSFITTQTRYSPIYRQRTSDTYRQTPDFSTVSDSQSYYNYILDASIFIHLPKDRYDCSRSIRMRKPSVVRLGAS
uniref:Light-independent protochlorophyllide reductase subunit B n=1 Tax=Actinostachys pennula TaxID=148577 RepID=A0A1S5RUP2_9MONI|nr:protochlorophyllide reductase subunit B [Actinostachys pennula]AOV84690.1 protochlorophyllide reductase subunit B [Actinostachys pennula]